MFHIVIVVGVVLILGFGALLLSRFDIQTNFNEYLARKGLPPSTYEGRGTLLEFTGGMVLTLAIMVLLERLVNTGRQAYETWAIVALIGGCLLGGIQIVDGLDNLSPNDLIDEIYPAYFFPLNLVMGLLALATYIPTGIVVVRGGHRAAAPPQRY
jgi:hypothetical protein